MDFGFTDEQNAIKETAREMLAKRSPLSAVREAAESRTYPDALWPEIRDLGWPGIAIDEEHGGQGLGLVELVILSEELGYACAPTPFLSNAIAGLVIDAAGSDAQRDRWLPGIASGEERGSIAGTGDQPGLVPDAEGAAVIGLDPMTEPRLVEASAATIEPVELIDATRAYARVSADGGEPLEGDVARGLQLAAVALSAELVGISQRAMDLAVEYAKER